MDETVRFKYGQEYVKRLVNCLYQIIDKDTILFFEGYKGAHRRVCKLIISREANRYRFVPYISELRQLDVRIGGVLCDFIDGKICIYFQDFPIISIGQDIECIYCHCHGIYFHMYPSVFDDYRTRNYKKMNEMFDEITSINHSMQQLMQNIEEMRFAPGGIEYQITKERFDKMKSVNN